MGAKEKEPSEATKAKLRPRSRGWQEFNRTQVRRVCGTASVPGQGVGEGMCRYGALLLMLLPLLLPWT